MRILIAALALGVGLTAGPALAETSYMVFFEKGKTSIAPKSMEVIDQAAVAFKGATGKVVVVAHADRSGSAAANVSITKRRGEAVRAALAKRGVSKARITVEAAGEGAPLVPTADGTEEGGNRRAEIRLVP